MAKQEWRVIGGGVRRPEIADEDKARTIAEVYVKGRNLTQTVEDLYKKLRRPVPKQPAVILSNWRAAFNLRLKRGDPALLRLCQSYEIVRAID